MFPFTWLVVICRREGSVRLKLDIQGRGGGRMLGVDGQGGGGLKNWTTLMAVICVWSLIVTTCLGERFGVN